LTCLADKATIGLQAHQLWFHGVQDLVVIDACTRPRGRDGGLRRRKKETHVFQILGLIVVGAIIGVLARLIVPGKQHISMVMTVVLGIVGAIIGGLIGGLINDKTNIFELNVLGFILAVVAAVVLVGAYAGMAGRGSRAVR
jgi:uncharacterized membrane protein YeaQ/YmgE (transglycosylase-associated protein family)